MQRIIQSIDRFQQHHPIIGFPFAVIRKFSDDQGGYQAALITYYGFLSVFPLLLVIVTLLQLLFHNNVDLQQGVATSISHFFPELGNQLQENVHSLRGTGIGLVVGILVTIYGARGVADVLRNTLDNIWRVPRKDRPGFPKANIQSLEVIGMVALGFLATVGVSSFSAALGHATWVKAVANFAGFVVLFNVLLFVFRTATARKVATKDMLIGTSFTAIMVQLLLTFGSVLVARQLKHLDALYGTFAITLGVLFWIYVLAQMIVYGAEIDSVRHLKLWPRALRSHHPTRADKKMQKLSH